MSRRPDHSPSTSKPASRAARLGRRRPGPLAVGAAAAALAAGLVTAVLPGSPVRPTQAAAAGSPSVITVSLDGATTRMEKPGLGSLFGVSSQPRLDTSLVTQTQNVLSAHQSRQGDASYPSSTEAVAGQLKGTGVLMDGRYNDMVPGFPYQWYGLDRWLADIDSATRGIQAYRSELYAVTPFNEPDNKFGTAADSPFMTDPKVQGSTYDQRVDWLWTQTVRHIRAIDATIPIMGPNYEVYAPYRTAGDQQRMRDFLTNAKATGTTPQIIGWHSLGASPGDVPASLTDYYRPLESELGIPGAPLPVAVEEYGPGTGDFEGVPGTMVKHWAEFARYGIDHASQGIYTNDGLLGNTLRRVYGSSPQPNGGWYFERWYKQMPGLQVPVSSWRDRFYQASDGVAAWDQSSRTATLIAGGQDGDVDVRFTGVAARGLTGSVRVRLDMTRWDVDPNAVGGDVENTGGDRQSGTYNLVDRVYPVASDGSVTVPIHRMEGYAGYRVRLSPPAAADSHPHKYEAEQAKVTGGVLHTGSDSGLASGTGYVGGLDSPTSSVAFTVSAQTTGIYDMVVRYANGGSATATQTVTVDGRPQGSVSYLDGGWANVSLRTVVKRLALTAGTHTVTLTKGSGSAELDAIEVRNDLHRSEAEYAKVTGASKLAFDYNPEPGYVGAIDDPGDSVDFAMVAPKAGSYRVDIGYADNTGAAATHTVTVNGSRQGSATYAATDGWFDTAVQDRVEKQTSVTVTLEQGLNHVVLGKGTGYAELDYAHLVYTGG